MTRDRNVCFIKIFYLDKSEQTIYFLIVRSYTIILLYSEIVNVSIFFFLFQLSYKQYIHDNHSFVSPSPVPPRLRAFQMIQSRHCFIISILTIQLHLIYSHCYTHRGVNILLLLFIKHLPQSHLAKRVIYILIFSFFFCFVLFFHAIASLSLSFLSFSKRKKYVVFHVYESVSQFPILFLQIVKHFCNLQRIRTYVLRSSLII